MTNMIQIQQGLSSSSMRIEEVPNMAMMQKKQGIVTILESNFGDTNTPSEQSSLRRTLSADMSSQKWVSHEIIKKVPSSEELMQQNSSASEDEAEAERDRLEIWSSIQRNKIEEKEKDGSNAFDMWNSLMSLKEKNEISKSLPSSPYIHPLVKRTKSCLSEKSLEICTESLGSETGSDGLVSSYPSSETEEEKEEEHQQHEEVEEEEEKEKVVIEEEPKYNYGGGAATKKYSPSRSFPPPLPSLGPSLHMRTHRDNGRLVLEAVSVPTNNNFCVQRQDGRLVLTFANQEETNDAAADEVSEENDDDGVAVEEFEEIPDEDEVDETLSYFKVVESVVIEKAPLLSSEVTANGVHRLAMMMNKPIGLVNKNQEWSEKFNEVEVEKSTIAKSLLPKPRVARLIPSTNFNAYEYYWKTKPTTTKDATTTLSNSLPYHKKHNNSTSTLVNNNSTSKVIFSGSIKQMSNDQRQQLMVVREKNGDYKLVHNLDQSCKDSRRSFLFWEPYCIATS
ncbi:putative WD40/YVTN repeat-like-containing domain, The fantastic four family [Lupinus albus]|uniref:Putative WD40/YVTN repeat-like-containing domain, The fantastic four family n=1 Tax=Lupinus albus TaxID=3870 RepID=A0A6A4R3J7_LUPAL|nr:putative WD40/YVTN repeat-like-containing domain, The fantastic four family [Lupinus albus]